MKLLLSIAAGGAFGAVGRYLLMSRFGHWFGFGFPFGTLAVNIIGALALGSLVEIMALVWSPSPEMRAFLVVGVLGSFTTFSTFSLDVVTLAERGQWLPAGSYVAASVVLSVTAFLGGMALFRQLLA